MKVHISFTECVLHALIIAIPMVVVVMLGIYRVAPGGEFVVSADTLQRSPYINRILPEDRAPKSTEGEYVALIADPAYFSVNIPTENFTSVDVALTYRNNGQSIVELGALTDMYAQSFDLQPLENKILTDSTWHALRDGSRVVLQRVEKYTSINEFLANPPERSRIATYHDDLVSPYREAGYVPLGSEQSFKVSLRGYHKIVTYLGGEDLDFTFGFMDMNRAPGTDEGVVRVWNEENEVVYERRFSDDGNTGDNQISSAEQTVVVTGSRLATGVYTIELSGTSDIFWRQVRTAQRYATFVNRLYIGDDVGYLPMARATSFFTDAKYLTFETFHADSPQHIMLGAVEVSLPDSHEKKNQEITEPGIVTGTTPAGDVKITGEGLFAFSRAAFFNPYPTRLSVHTDLEARGIDYILADYAPPVAVGDGWQTASATFALAPIVQADGTAKFILSAPGIADLGASVDIKTIALTFHKDPLTLRSALAGIWRMVTPW